MKKESVLFVGDWDEAWSQAAQELRNEGHEIIGWVNTSREALLKLPQNPSLVITDVELSDLSGIDFCRMLTLRESSPKIIFFTNCSTGTTIFEAVLAGCSGYVLKKDSPSRLINEIRKIAQGNPSLHSEAKPISAAFLKHSLDRSSLIAKKLTGREQEISYLLSQSKTYQEIGNILGISANTVRNHTSHILRKLNLRSRTSIGIMVTRAIVRSSES